MTNREYDARLLTLDFVGETGEMIAMLGAAVCAAAASGNIELCALALRQIGVVLREAISEMRTLTPPAADVEGME